MQPTNKLQSQADAELDKFRKETIFPSENLPTVFKDLVQQALSFVPLLTNPLTAQDVHDLCFGESYNMHQIGIILNAMKQRSPRDLGLTMSDYILYMKDFTALSEAYGFILQPEIDRLNAKYKKLSEIEMEKMKHEMNAQERKNSGKTLQLGKSKPVKADA